MDSLWNREGWEAFMSQSTIFMPSNSQPVLLQTQSQPQPQLHAMLPPGGKQGEARKYTANDWDVQRPEITRLYEKNTLNSVAEFMRERHGLDATPKQYKDRIRKWGLNKNIQPDEMEAMIRKQQKRLLESNKPSAFRVRKRPVAPEKINRYIKEHTIEPIAENHNNYLGGNTGVAVTPAGISCYTPSDTGPLTPLAVSSPLATSNLEASFFYQSAQSGSYQFGDLSPPLTSSPWAAQTTTDFYGQSSSPVPIAASPTLAFPAPIGLEEIAFTGQSPMPFSVPSTPQADNYEVPRDEIMGFTNNESDSKTLASLCHIAKKLVELGRYKAAERMHQQVLELRQTTLGPEHPDTLTSMASLAYVRMRQGRFGAAEQMSRQTLQLRQKLLGSEHPDTLAIMDNLGAVLRYQGKYNEVEQIHRQTLQLNQKLLGPEHPNTLGSMNNLGAALYRQSKYVEAEQMHRQTLQLMQKALGLEHPDTLGSMNNLGVSLNGQGRYVEAEQMHRQTLQLKQKVLGHEHPSTLLSIKNLQLALTSQNKYIEAEQMYSWHTGF